MTSFIGSIFKEKQDADDNSGTYDFLEANSCTVYNMKGNPIEIIADVRRAGLMEQYPSRDGGRSL